MIDASSVPERSGAKKKLWNRKKDAFRAAQERFASMRCSSSIFRAAAAAFGAACIVALFFTLRLTRSAPAAGSASLSVAPNAVGIRCWIVLDLDSLSCSPCLEPLLDFRRVLPERVQEERIMAVLVTGRSSGDETGRRRATIARKKWQGYSKANGIRFAGVVDEAGFFRAPLQAAAVLLLFDRENGRLKAYPFPLRPGQIDEIMAVLIR
jgi:hypothetical protein